MTALSSVMFWANMPEPTTAAAIVNEPSNSEISARTFLLDMKFLPGTFNLLRDTLPLIGSLNPLVKIEGKRNQDEHLVNCLEDVSLFSQSSLQMAKLFLTCVLVLLSLRSLFACDAFGIKLHKPLHLVWH